MQLQLICAMGPHATGADEQVYSDVKVNNA